MFERTLKLINLELKIILWKIHKLFHKTFILNTKQGKYKVFTSDDVISRALYYYGEYERDLYLKVYKHLKSQGLIRNSEGTVLDIGANIGVISIGILKDKFAKRAIAIEADPQNFLSLKNNVKLNGFKNSIVLSPYAVSDKNKKVNFELSRTIYGDHRIRSNLYRDEPELYDESKRKVITVPAKTIDELLETFPNNLTNRINLIWIDIQGSEGHAFLGGKNLFSKNIPVVLELWPYGLKRLGMTKGKFINIANRFWRYHWVERKGKFIRYPNTVLDVLFQEIGYGKDSLNIILTK